MKLKIALLTAIGFTVHVQELEAWIRIDNDNTFYRYLMNILFLQFQVVLSTFEIFWHLFQDSDMNFGNLYAIEGCHCARA